MILNNLYLDYVKKRKLLFLKYFLIVCLTFPAESLVISRMYSELFNNLKKTGDINNSYNKYLIIAIIAVWCIIILFFYFKSSIHAKIIPDYLSFIRSKIFSLTIKFYKNDYKDIKIGKFITRLLGLARILKNIMVDVLEYIFPLGFTILAISAYFYYLNFGIGIISSVGFLVIIYIIYRASKHCIDCSANKEKQFINMSELLHNSFSNLMNVYLNNEDNNEIKKNKEIEKKQSGLLKKEFDNVTNLVFYLSIASALIFSGIIFYSYTILKQNKISIKDFINILVILIGYFSYLIKFSKIAPKLLTQIGIIKNSEYFLNLIFKVNKSTTEMTNNSLKGDIRFENISFKYDKSNKNLFNNLNLQIKNNEKIAIMGTSGTGKTSLIKLLLKMYKLNAGKIYINDNNINKIDTNKLRSSINYINQRTILFNDTIINNMKYGNGIPDKDIVNLLEKYQLNKVFEKLEHKYYQVAGVNGSNLSLGMQKVTMIIRGLLRKCDTVIYDEPLAGLDETTRGKIMKLIKDHSDKKTVLIITHNKEVIPYMDRIINLNDYNC